MFDKLDFGNLGGMLSEVQKKAQQMQEAGESRVYEAKSGGGMVCVKANGKGEVIDMDIDDSLLEDKESLQILVISAVNEVFKEIEKGKKEAAMGMLGDMGAFMGKKE